MKIQSPAILQNLDRVIPADELAAQLAKEGTKGSYCPRPGITVHYGWEDGKAHSYLEISDELMKDMLELCACYRELEKTGQVLDGVNGGTFMSWPYLDVELQARGLDYNLALREKDTDMLEAIHKCVELEFPQFKLTNRRLWIPREAR